MVLGEWFTIIFMLIHGWDQGDQWWGKVQRFRGSKVESTPKSRSCIKWLLISLQLKIFSHGTENAKC